MVYSISTLIIILITFFSSSMVSEVEQNQDVQEAVNQESNSVLVFTKTEGWRHDSIEAGVEAIYQLGNENGFAVTWTEDSEQFTLESLSKYDAVIFLNTTLTLFDSDQREALQTYIKNGGGFVGIHSAADTEYDWPWYGELVGAYFNSHPNNPNVREAVVETIDFNHPSTEHLPQQWNRNDEWYNFGYMNDQVNVLLKLDTDSYEGSEHPGNHPIAWYHEFDGGRSFYTGSGHTIESFSEPLFLDHLLGGIQYSMGLRSMSN